MIFSKTSVVSIYNQGRIDTNLLQVQCAQMVEMLGEKFLILGLSNGSITLVNTSLKSHNLQIQPGSKVSSLTSTVLDSQPLVLVALESMNNGGCIYCINLINWACNRVLECQMGISEIVCVYDKLFVGFKS
jgi:hypothetical protein